MNLVMVSGRKCCVGVASESMVVMWEYLIVGGLCVVRCSILLYSNLSSYMLHKAKICIGKTTDGHIRVVGDTVRVMRSMHVGC